MSMLYILISCGNLDDIRTCTRDVLQVGSRQWMTQHEWFMKLNIQVRKVVYETKYTCEKRGFMKVTLEVRKG